MDMEIKYRYEDVVQEYEFTYKGGYYKARFRKYSDCISIIDILYVCDDINRDDIKNIYLREYEIEYKQINELLKKEVLEV